MPQFLFLLGVWRRWERTTEVRKSLCRWLGLQGPSEETKLGSHFYGIGCVVTMWEDGSPCRERVGDFLA